MKIQKPYCLSGRIFENGNRITLDIERFFKFANDKNCTSVELRHTQINPWSTEEEIQKIKNLSATCRLPVEMITMRKGKLNTEEDYEIFQRYLKLAVALNCHQIKVSGNNLKLLKKAAEEASEKDVIIGTNNHIGSPLETKKGTINFLKQVGSSNFKLLFDPSHLWVNKDPADSNFIAEISESISYLIIQDYVEGDGMEFTTLPKRKVRGTTEDEYGQVGYYDIMKMLDEINCHIPYGLVQAGALYFLQKYKKKGTES
jgi:sugar phosphate isomerase/epimerase